MIKRTVWFCKTVEATMEIEAEDEEDLLRKIDAVRFGDVAVKWEEDNHYPPTFRIEEEETW